VIDYNRESWWGTCFSFSGTVLPAVLPRVGVLTLFALLVTLANEFYLHQHGDPLVGMDPLGHTVLGVALGLLTVFRTNSSYHRFWEARSHWGALVNASRNLVRLAAVYARPAGELARLVTAYVLALKEGLRGGRDLSGLRTLLSGRVLDLLGKANNPATMLSEVMSEWVRARQVEGRLDSIQGMRLEEQVSKLVDAQGACEKIRRTPLPFAYAALIKQVLFLYLYSLPFVLVAKMGYIAPVVVAGVSLVLLGIEEAGVEIEDPFGDGPNHLPLDAICQTIGRDAADLAAEPEGEAG
jgi:putative membrane protein